jgi:hypothetical protein
MERDMNNRKPNRKTDSRVIALLEDREKCPFHCKTRFSGGLIQRKTDTDWVLNKEFEFHAKDTHGFPSDILVEWIVNLVYGLHPSGIEK